MPVTLHTVPEALAWLAERRATALTTDSRQVRLGSIIVCEKHLSAAGPTIRYRSDRS